MQRPPFRTAIVLCTALGGCTAPTPHTRHKPVFFADEGVSLGYETRPALSADTSFDGGPERIDSGISWCGW